MADLGKKHECPECGAKFYDLGKPDPVCPRCGTPVEGEDAPASKTVRRKKSAPSRAKARVQAQGDDDLSGDDGQDGEDYEDLDDDIDDDGIEGLEGADLEDDDIEDEEDDDDED